MLTALQMLVVYLEELLYVQRKMVAVGLVEYSPLFLVLVRFYGMLQKRFKGEVRDWDWQDWLEDIDDDSLRLRLRVALENDPVLCGPAVHNDEAPQSGGLAVLDTRRGRRRRREANLAS